MAQLNCCEGYKPGSGSAVAVDEDGEDGPDTDDPRRVATKCGGKWSMRACPTGDGFYSRIWTGCMRRSCTCPECMDHVRHERAKRLYSRFAKLGRVVLVKITFTVPESRRNPSRESVKRRQGLARKRAERWLRKHHFAGVQVQLGGTVLVHPCGEDPDRWGEHYNVLIPLRGLDGDRWVDGQPFVSPEALEELREGWAEDLGWDGDCKIQVWYNYTKPEDENDLRHDFLYFGRGFPSWAGWTHRVSYFGLLSGRGGACLPPLPDEDAPHEWDTAPDPMRCPICARKTIEVFPGDPLYPADPDKPWKPTPDEDRGEMPEPDG